MIELYDFKQILEQIIACDSSVLAKQIAKNYLVDIDAKIIDYEAQLIEQYKQEQDSEISL